MTMDEVFEAKCKEMCPHCAAGETVRQRQDTMEWVHDYLLAQPNPRHGSRTISHGMCLAHDLRSKNEQ